MEQDVRIAALEEAHECLPEVLANGLEGADEEIRRRLVDLADRRAQVVPRLHEIVPLLGEEVELRLLLTVLLDGEHGHRSERVQRLHQLLELLLEHLGIALDRYRLGAQRLPRPAPLAFEALRSE